MKGWSLADLRAKGLILDEDRARPMLGGKAAAPPERALPSTMSVPVAGTATGHVQAKRRGPNKWEAAYAREVLEPRRLAGEVLRYDFEALSLRIGCCRYTADWCVQAALGVELHEVKGWMREAARVRLSAVLEMYPFPIVVARGGPGKWVTELWRKGA